jgi:[acyl-carrier-protein] S-malonyltransferase
MDAVMFPGQGSQRPGMGEPWASAPSWAVVDRVSEVLGRDVGALLLDADAATLQATRNAQVASFALGLVILGAAEAAGVTWGAAAGHSLGEYTALVAAGVLERDDATRLVGARSDAMQAAADASPGTMAAVLGLDEDAVQASCDAAGGGAWIANDNAPGQVVVAGTVDGVARASAAAKDRGAKVMPLAVGGAFHTPLMAGAQAGLDAALGATPFRDGACPVVANVDAAPHRAGDEWRALLSAQLCRPVRWRAVTEQLVSLGVTRVYELGPGAVLSGLVKRTAPSVERAPVATPADLA